MQLSVLRFFFLRKKRSLLSRGNSGVRRQQIVLNYWRQSKKLAELGLQDFRLKAGFMSTTNFQARSAKVTLSRGPMARKKQSREQFLLRRYVKYAVYTFQTKPGLAIATDYNTALTTLTHGVGVCNRVSYKRQALIVL